MFISRIFTVRPFMRFSLVHYHLQSINYTTYINAPYTQLYMVYTYILTYTYIPIYNMNFLFFRCLLELCSVACPYSTLLDIVWREFKTKFLKKKCISTICVITQNSFNKIRNAVSSLEFWIRCRAKLIVNKPTE